MSVFVAMLGLLALTGQALTAETPLRRAGINLIPYPQTVALGGEDFVFDSPVSVSTDPGAGEEELFAADELIRGLRDEHGIDNVTRSETGSRKIVLSLRGAADKLGPQGYSLETSSEAVTLRANTPAGLFHGVQTLLQAIVPLRGGPGIPGLRIEDWPDIPNRAVHYDTKHFQEKADYVESFIRELARYKINMLIWEWEDKFEYQRRPEIGAPGAFTPERMREFTAYAKKYHIQVVPLVQGLGHVSYILKHPKYKHLREIPSSNWEICPLKDESFEVLFDLWEEAIDATPGSEYLHVGTDETWELGVGIECGCAAKAGQIGRYGLMQLFLHRVSERLAPRGRKIMSWGGEYRSTEKTRPPKGLIAFGLHHEDDKLSVDAGYPVYYYDPNPGIEHLFLPYLYREDASGNEITGSLEESAKSVGPAALRGIYDGMVSTSWNCSGVHNQGWMLRYATGAEYSWSGGAPGWEEFRDKFFDNHYGPKSRDVKELYRLLSEGAYYYMDSFERKVWHWGEVGKTHLPDLPRDDIEFDPFWNTRYRERVEKSRAMLRSMSRARQICGLNLAAGTRNSYDFELFDCLAELFEHTANTYLTLSRVERSVTEAHQKHFDDHAAALIALEQAGRAVQANLAERARVFGRIRQTWEKTQLPKGLSTTEKKYVHGRDRQRNFANRRPDLSFMIYDEELLNLEGWLADLNKYIAWYRGEYIGGK